MMKREIEIEIERESKDIAYSYETETLNVDNSADLHCSATDLVCSIFCFILPNLGFDRLSSTIIHLKLIRTMRIVVSSY